MNICVSFFLTQTLFSGAVKSVSIIYIGGFGVMLFSDQKFREIARVLEDG